MTSAPPQIFRDDKGNSIPFGLNFPSNESEQERIKNLIERHGGRVVGEFLISTGYLLVDDGTAVGRQIHGTRNLPPQLCVVHFTWVERCVASGELVPPFLQPTVFLDDGSMRKIHLHASLSDEEAAELKDVIQDAGGDMDVAEEEADTIAVSAHYQYSVRTTSWFIDQVNQGHRPMLGRPKPAEGSQRAALAPQQADDTGAPTYRVPYTAGGDLRRVGRDRKLFRGLEIHEFIKYLANPERLIAGSLSGIKLYDAMREKHAWARRHSSESWRKHYLRYRENYRERIGEEARRAYLALPRSQQLAIEAYYEESDYTPTEHEEPDGLFSLHQGLQGLCASEGANVRERSAEQLPEDHDPMRRQHKHFAMAGEDLDWEEEVPGADEAPVLGYDLAFWEKYAGAVGEDADSSKPVFSPRPRRAPAAAAFLPPTEGVKRKLQSNSDSYDAPRIKRPRSW